MIYTKSKGYRSTGSGEDLFKVFTIYGHGSHVEHVTQTFRTFFVPRDPEGCI